MQILRKAVLLLVLMITMSVSAAAPAFANGGGTTRPKPVFNVQLCHEGATISVNLFNFFELLRHLCHGDKIGPCAGLPDPF
jgi:hypothetical protein